MIINKIYTNICYYVSVSNHYSQFVHENQIHINNRINNRQYDSYKLPISFVDLVFPTFICFSFGFRAFLVLYYIPYINTPLLTVQFFGAIFTEDVRYYTELNIFFWSVLHTLHSIYTLWMEINRYKFFAVIVCDSGDCGITHANLGLFYSKLIPFLSV